MSNMRTLFDSIVNIDVFRNVFVFKFSGLAKSNVIAGQIHLHGDLLNCVDEGTFC